MAWSWSKKQAPSPTPNRGCLGIDLDASRARAATGVSTRNRIIPLDDPHPDLPLAISLEKRALEIGRAGNALRRRLPHLVCIGHLPFLGQALEWKAGRHRFDAAAAVALAFERLRSSCSHFENRFLGVPAYLTPQQTAKLTAIAAKSNLPLRGTAGSALAVAADRARALIDNLPPDADRHEDWIVPLRRSGQTPLPADALVVDADDYALTASLIRIEDRQVSLLGTIVVPQLNSNCWTGRLLDSVSDRCVRICRRDPRDSAEAEQLLFEQIEASLDRVRAGDKVILTVRSAHWYQDIELQPEEFDACCAPLSRRAAASIHDLAQGGSSAEPPRAIWLTHEAGRLPGLAKALHQNMTERTSVGVLRPESIAVAVANLGERWLAGELPGTHLDSQVPIQLLTPASKQQPIPAVKSHR